MRRKVLSQYLSALIFFNIYISLEFNPLYFLEVLLGILYFYSVLLAIGKHHHHELFDQGIDLYARREVDWFLDYLDKDLHVIIYLPGQHRAHQTVENDTYRPDIALNVVGLMHQHLR